MRYVFGILLAMTSCAAVAQKAPWEEYDKFIKSAQTIKTEGPGLFGDSVNLYTGAVSFAATDVSLPGNNALPVAIGRRFSAQADTRNRPFGDWDWDVPYISGMFSREAGWVLGDAPPSATPNRCSSPTSPETARPPGVKVSSSTPGRSGVVHPWEYWSGYRMSAPGGEQELLLATAETRPRPTNGTVYPWVTNKFWHLSCVPIQGGQAGEGFLALAPDGTKYRFDWMVARPSDDLLKPFAGDGTILQRPVPRDEIRLYATRVEDRFGNWVAYNWNGNRLASITSSDGRELSLTWENVNNADRIKKVSANTTPVREWNYGYSAYLQLNSVILPDASRWSINLAEMWGPPLYDQTEEVLPPDGRRVPKQDKTLHCSWMRALNPINRVATILHPSGATGEFVFRTLRHGRTYVPFDCLPPPSLGGTLPLDPEPEDTLTSMLPARFDVLAIQSKRVTGPGLPGYTWQYQYTTPNGGWADSCANCESTKTTTVLGPGGERTVNTYGVIYNVNEGQLLKTEVFGGSSVLRSTTTTYLSNAAAPQQPFADRMGISPQIRLDSFSSERLRPTVASSTVQDATTFNTTINSFDVFAQPANKTEASSLGYSRTSATEYYNDLSKWVIGQVQREINVDTGAVVSQSDYDPVSVLPIRLYAFGKLQQTLAYNADGTLASVKDGRNLITTVSNWKRGTPQTVTFQDGTQKNVVVDNSGWITSVTEENGYVTNFGYDSMGRMSRVVHPTGDDTVWNDTSLRFEPVGADELGLPAGHWRHVVATGNSKKTTYFDALWRPVVEQEEDISNPQATARWSMKCYDHEGRVTFSSYPRNPFVDGARNFDCAGLAP